MRKDRGMGSKRGTITRFVNRDALGKKKEKPFFRNKKGQKDGTVTKGGRIRIL